MSNRRQPSMRDASNKNDKTYVWVRLRDGKFGAPTPGSNVASKKRGAPSSNGSNDVWGWAPGYYSSVGDGNNNGATSPGSGEEKDVGEGTVQYHFTLLGLDKPAGEQDGGDFGTSEHTLTEVSAKKLLESGEIVLANAWEQYDFVNRLELGDDGDDDDSYNYDEDSDEDDDMNQRGSFLDAPDETPPFNLIELTHLHEPSVVHALRHRYANTAVDMSNIYTDTGPILLAINPFKHDESGLLYGDQTVKKYRKEGELNWSKEQRVIGGGKQTAGDEEQEPPLPPHVYSVADRVFRTMMRRLSPATDTSSSNAAAVAASKSSAPLSPQSVNQSVLVSGESGAGKTVTTKLLMAYLSKLSENPAAAAAAADNNKEEVGDMSIEKRVLESNPIMESFGNARTIRNDNSSRFGKYIEMKFVSKTDTRKSVGGTKSFIPGAALIGASIETYLLEKVRLVHQSPGERNYHIFYELFSMKYDDGGDEEDELDLGEGIVEKMGLLDYDMEDFRLINTSDTYDRRDGVTDSETFSDMKRAMSIMGFTSPEITAVFKVTTALLHASNLTFERVAEVECALETDNPHLDYVVDLLGITKEGLNSALCYHEITIGGTGRKGGETHQKVLAKDKCEKGVEALIKATYGAMFNYLVQRINVSVAGDGGAGGGNTTKARRGGSERGASIGILDIFGFESFQINSFEQLCINYCNEALQQQFNRFVLHNEQVEYDREGIPWSFIDFPENQNVLDLIDHKGSGILNVLHDQCRTPGASDKTFAMLLYDKCSKNERFEADSRQVAEKLFGINHYAGLVEYDVAGFIEKNQDELPKSGSDLLLSSNNDFVKILAEILQPTSSSGAKGKKMMSPRGGAAQRPTVGIQFSSQLHSLRRKIDDTSPHYIRCIKPNNLLVADHFDAALIADQLRCAGVIEAVRVSRLGYPQRFSHTQFIARYGILGRKLKKKNNAKKYNPAKALVHSITQRLKDQSDVGIQVGKTKVFLRRQAYDLLEKLRREIVASASVTIQKLARRYICQKRFSKALHSLLTIQCFVRKTLAVKVVTEMRRQHNSVIIQQSWRKYAARKRFTAVQIVASWCQAHQRGSAGRKMFNELKRDQKAQYLQARWRGYVVLKSFSRQITAALTIQCAKRCYSARLELDALKSAARDFSAVAQERDRLRQEAIALRDELKKMKYESRVESVQQAVVEDSQGFDSGEKDAEIESLRIALDQLTKEKEVADNELEEIKKSIETMNSERDLAIQDRDDLNQVNKILQTDLNSREEELQCVKKDMEKVKRSTIKLNVSNAQESQSARIVSTDPTQVLVLKNELQSMQEANVTLQVDNDQLKEDYYQLKEANHQLTEDTHQLNEENSFLKSKTADLVKPFDEMAKKRNKPVHRLSAASETEKEAHKQSMVIEEKSHDAVPEKKSTMMEEKSPGAVNSSVCTGLTVDMDRSEDEMTRLREENQVLRKQLKLLRANNEFQDIPQDRPDDQEYDDSVVLESNSSATEYIGEANAVPESVMKQICSEVEIVTEEVIIKTRAESESRIAKLRCEIEYLKTEMEQSEELAQYDLDDMTRVNRSLREELQAITEDKLVVENELEMRCEEFDTLTEDVERFAETFAEQNEELQQAERLSKKLQLENEKLKASNEDKTSRIAELEAQKEVKSEITKLWEELGRLKETPSSDERQNRSSSSGSDDTISEEES